jgi:hypothetical protein
VRDAFIIGLFYAAMAALMAALAAKYAGPLFWEIVQWGAITLMVGCAASMWLSYSHQSTGKPFLWPALCINLGLCAITAGFLWHYSAGSVLAPGPLANLTNAQLRERAISIAQGLRQLQNSYNTQRTQLSLDNFGKMRTLTNDFERHAELQAEIAQSTALNNQMETEFRNRFRSDAIILRDEFRTRLNPLPLPRFQVFTDAPSMPADTQIFDKPFLAGPDPLAGGADLLEYWAKQLP